MSHSSQEAEKNVSQGCTKDDSFTSAPLTIPELHSTSSGPMSLSTSETPLGTSSRTPKSHLKYLNRPLHPPHEQIKQAIEPFIKVSSTPFQSGSGTASPSHFRQTISPRSDQNVLNNSVIFPRPHGMPPNTPAQKPLSNVSWGGSHTGSQGYDTVSISSSTASIPLDYHLGELPGLSPASGPLQKPKKTVQFQGLDPEKQTIDVTVKVFEPDMDFDTFKRSLAAKIPGTTQERKSHRRTRKKGFVNADGVIVGTPKSKAQAQSTSVFLSSSSNGTPPLTHTYNPNSFLPPPELSLEEREKQQNEKEQQEEQEKLLYYADVSVNRPSRLIKSEYRYSPTFTPKQVCPRHPNRTISSNTLIPHGLSPLTMGSVGPSSRSMTSVAGNTPESIDTLDLTRAETDSEPSIVVTTLTTTSTYSPPPSRKGSSVSGAVSGGESETPSSNSTTSPASSDDTTHSGRNTGSAPSETTTTIIHHTNEQRNNNVIATNLCPEDYNIMIENSSKLLGPYYSSLFQAVTQGNGAISRQSSHGDDEHDHSQQQQQQQQQYDSPTLAANPIIDSVNNQNGQDTASPQALAELSPLSSSSSSSASASSSSLPRRGRPSPASDIPKDTVTVVGAVAPPPSQFSPLPRRLSQTGLLKQRVSDVQFNDSCARLLTATLSKALALSVLGKPQKVILLNSDGDPQTKYMWIDSTKEYLLWSDKPPELDRKPGFFSRLFSRGEQKTEIYRIDHLILGNFTRNLSKIRKARYKSWHCITISFANYVRRVKDEIGHQSSTKTEQPQILQDVEIVCQDDEQTRQIFMGIQALIPLNTNHQSYGKFLWKRASLKMRKLAFDRVMLKNDYVAMLWAQAKEFKFMRFKTASKMKAKVDAYRFVCAQFAALCASNAWVDQIGDLLKTAIDVLRTSYDNDLALVNDLGLGDDNDDDENGDGDTSHDSDHDETLTQLFDDYNTSIPTRSRSRASSGNGTFPQPSTGDDSTSTLPITKAPDTVEGQVSSKKKSKRINWEKIENKLFDTFTGGCHPVMNKNNSNSEDAIDAQFTPITMNMNATARQILRSILENLVVAQPLNLREVCNSRSYLRKFLRERILENYLRTLQSNSSYLSPSTGDNSSGAAAADTPDTNNARSTLKLPPPDFKLDRNVFINLLDEALRAKNHQIIELGRQHIKKKLTDEYFMIQDIVSDLNRSSDLDIPNRISSSSSTSSSSFNGEDHLTIGHGSYKNAPPLRPLDSIDLSALDHPPSFSSPPSSFAAAGSTSTPSTLLSPHMLGSYPSAGTRSPDSASPIASPSISLSPPSSDTKGNDGDTTTMNSVNSLDSDSNDAAVTQEEGIMIPSPQSSSSSSPSPSSSSPLQSSNDSDGRITDISQLTLDTETTRQSEDHHQSAFQQDSIYPPMNDPLAELTSPIDVPLESIAQSVEMAAELRHNVHVEIPSVLVNIIHQRINDIVKPKSSSYHDETAIPLLPTLNTQNLLSVPSIDHRQLQQQNTATGTPLFNPTNTPGTRTGAYPHALINNPNELPCYCHHHSLVAQDENNISHILGSIEENSIDPRTLVNYISLVTNDLQDQFMKIGDDYFLSQFKQQQHELSQTGSDQSSFTTSNEDEIHKILMEKVRPQIHRKTELFNQLKRLNNPSLLQGDQPMIIEFLAHLRAAIYPYATGFEKELVKESLELAIIVREVVGSLASEPVESHVPIAQDGRPRSYHMNSGGSTSTITPSTTSLEGGSVSMNTNSSSTTSNSMLTPTTTSKNLSLQSTPPATSDKNNPKSNK